MIFAAVSHASTRSACSLQSGADDSLGAMDEPTGGEIRRGDSFRVGLEGMDDARARRGALRVATVAKDDSGRVSNRSVLATGL